MRDIKSIRLDVKMAKAKARYRYSWDQFLSQGNRRLRREFLDEMIETHGVNPLDQYPPDHLVGDYVTWQHHDQGISEPELDLVDY